MESISINMKTLDCESQAGADFLQKLMYLSTQDQQAQLAGLSPDDRLKAEAAIAEDQKTILRLIYAAAHNDLYEVTRVGTGLKFDLNKSDYDKRTALHLACAEGHVEIVKYLINHADADKITGRNKHAQGVEINCADRWGNTPLREAMVHKHDHIVQLLLAAGASMGKVNVGQEILSAVDKGDLGQLITLLAAKADVNSHDYDDRSALHIAVCDGHHEIVKCLLENKADFNKKDRWDNTPFDDAKRVGVVRVGNDPITELLKASGAVSEVSDDVQTSPRFAWILIPMQAIMIILFAIFVTYGDGVAPNTIVNGTATDFSSISVDFYQRYPLFQDIHVMIFIGFGDKFRPIFHTIWLHAALRQPTPYP